MGEFEYFQKSYPELLKKYEGKYVAIVGEEVAGSGTAKEAYDAARKKYPDKVPFLAYITDFNNPMLFRVAAS